MSSQTTSGGQLTRENNLQDEESDGTMRMCESATWEVFNIEEDVSFRGKTLLCQLTLIKWIGIVIIATTCAVPVFCLLSYTDCSLPVNNVRVKPDLNQTACVYVKQFYLHDHVYATVCNQAGHVFLDIRKFANGTATIRGMDLNLLQWLTLKEFTSSIDTAVSEARNY